MKSLNQQIGENVRRARKAAGLSQAQLASALGCQQPLISRIENGMVAATIEVLVAIGEATGIAPALLLPVDEHPARTRIVQAAWSDSVDNARTLIAAGMAMMDRALGPVAPTRLEGSRPPEPVAPPDDVDPNPENAR